MQLHRICALAVLMLAGVTKADNATVPGEVTSPYPTILNLAVEWQIEGDDNGNCTVNVRYRPAGEEKWNEAMPLKRILPGETKQTRPIYKWGNKLSGSIFDLKPDTEYEIELKLKDPDGGEAEKTIKSRTRAVPKAAADAPVRKVNPKTIRDVEPGEIGLLEDGEYGRFVVTKDGLPGKPIVYRAAGKNAKFDSIQLKDRKHVYLEGLLVRRSNNKAGIEISFAEDCVVRRCDIEGVFGIRAHVSPGAKNCYIADNVIKGTTPWTNESMGAGGKNIGEGIEMTGPGNVICYNRVTNFRDCISTMEEEAVTDQRCIDIYNNDLEVGADDGIEADFTQGNTRVMRNRLTNCFVGLSSQPGMGGPNYFIRNVIYNLTYAPFKLHRWSHGDVILHNTVVKPGDGLACFSAAAFDYAFFRNNLCIGGPNGGVMWGKYGAGNGHALNLRAPGNSSDLDYDAIGTHGRPFSARTNNDAFKSIEELRSKTGYEKNGMVVGMDVFKDVAFPEAPETLYAPPDLRPKADAPVVDAGQRLPNINDKFDGKGPDIGAYEAGQPLPHYGPRPEGVDESTPR